MRQGETDPRSSASRALRPFGLLALLALLAVFFRVHQLRDQILGDDEWHAVMWATSATYARIATTLSPADNCIPLTLLYRFRLLHGGLHELDLRALQLILGILAVGLFPWRFRRVLGGAELVAYTGLLALSPLLVYYSRYARPYGIVVVLAFCAVLAFDSWIRRGGWRYGGLYIVLAVLAAYFNPPSLAAVLAPLPFAAIRPLRRWAGGTEGSRGRSPGGRELAFAALLVAAGLAACFLPAHGSFGAVLGKVAGGRLSAETVAGWLRLFSGSGSTAVSALFALLFLLGMEILRRRDRLLFGLFASVWIGSYGALLAVEPQRIFVPIVLARYSIACLPIYLLGAALGAAGITGWLARAAPRGTPNLAATLRTGTLLLLLAGWVGQGPLWQTYGVRNSFAGHDDFQYDYRRARRTGRSGAGPTGTLPARYVPAFYRSLREAPADTRIIEYPQVLWWSGTFYHHYQRIHRKRVLLGHPRDSYLITHRVLHPALRLRNSVDVFDPAAVRASGAAYLVVHKNPPAELAYLRLVLETGTDQGFADLDPARDENERRFGPTSRRAARELIEFYRERQGDPFYEDRWIAVFRLSPRGDAGANPQLSGSLRARAFIWNRESRSLLWPGSLEGERSISRRLTRSARQEIARVFAVDLRDVLR